MHDLHVATGWALIAVNAIAGCWCLAAYRLETLRGPAMWAVVVVGQLLALSQAVVGTVYAQQQDVELHDMHALYGFSALIAVAIMYSYRTSGFMRGKETLLYGFGSLFVMGLGLRNLFL